MNQLRENHGTKIVTEMLLVMLLNDLSVTEASCNRTTKRMWTLVSEPCIFLDCKRMKWFPRFIAWVSIFYCYSGSCRRLC